MTRRKDKAFAKRIALKADRLRMTEACLRATRSFKNKSEEEINYGSCFDWATIVFNAISGSKIAGQNIGGVGHSWIEWKGLVYDAEVPHGVRSWLKLPFWQRVRAEAGAKEFDKAVKKATA
jgi:hypothetical protein